MNSIEALDSLESLPAVVTAAEAAEALRVDVREIRQMVDSGQLPAARLGARRIIRIRRDAILSLLGGVSRPRGARRTRPIELRLAPQVGGTLHPEE